MNRYTCMKYLLYILLAKRFFSLTYDIQLQLSCEYLSQIRDLLITITIGCHRRFHRRARLETALNDYVKCDSVKLDEMVSQMTNRKGEKTDRGNDRLSGYRGFTTAFWGKAYLSVCHKNNDKLVTGKWPHMYPARFASDKRIYFDFIECFTTTFLRAHSWLNRVDEDDDEHDEVGLKEKPEDTRYIKKITSK